MSYLVIMNVIDVTDQTRYKQLKRFDRYLREAIFVVGMVSSVLMLVMGILTMVGRNDLVWQLVIPAVGGCLFFSVFANRRLSKNRNEIREFDVAMETFPEDRRNFFDFGTQESRREAEWKN